MAEWTCWNFTTVSRKVPVDKEQSPNIVSKVDWFAHIKWVRLLFPSNWHIEFNFNIIKRGIGTSNRSFSNIHDHVSTSPRATDCESNIFATFFSGQWFNCCHFFSCYFGCCQFCCCCFSCFSDTSFIYNRWKTVRVAKERLGRVTVTENSSSSFINARFDTARRCDRVVTSPSTFFGVEPSKLKIFARCFYQLLAKAVQFVL